MEEVVLNTFSPADAPSALIVSVGQRSEYVLSVLILVRSKTLITTAFLRVQMEDPFQPVQSSALERRIDSDHYQTQRCESFLSAGLPRVLKILPRSGCTSR